MAISYPRAFPAGAGFLRADFKLGDVSAFNILASGAIQTMELGEPLWTAEFTTFDMAMQDRQIWQAWGLSLRIGLTFLGWDPEKAFPAAYGTSVLTLTRAGGGAFDGTAVLNAYTATTVTLTTLPAAYQAKAGDMLSFAWNGVKALHMVLEDAAANSSGVVTLTVAPPVRTSPAPGASATVDLVRPACVMRLRPGSFSAPADYQPQPVTFQAVQVIV